MKTIDLIGQKFGRLIVIKLLDERHRRARLWLCKCDCGNEHKVITDLLRGGHVLSCGCLSKETSAKNGRLNRIEFGEASFNTLYGKYKYQAKRRNKTFNLSLDEFRQLTKMNCYYCGREPQLESKATKRCFGNYIYNGIDRLDNNIGYDTSNCVTCCENCNRAKRVMSVAEFRDWINRTYEHRRKTQW